METSFPEPPEFIAQGDRVLVVGFATGRIKATNKTLEDHWVFAITVRSGKLTNIREYIDTLALARASEMAAGRPTYYGFLNLGVWRGKRAGIGLAGMRERLRELGGRLEIEFGHGWYFDPCGHSCSDIYKLGNPAVFATSQANLSTTNEQGKLNKCESAGSPTPENIRTRAEGWLDVERTAVVEVTSEDQDSPIEGAFVSGTAQGWRAASAGVQTIRLIFDEPQKLRRIYLPAAVSGRDPNPTSG